MNESKGGELTLRRQKRRQSRRLLVTQSATTLTKEMTKPHSKWQPFLQHSLTHCSHLSVWTSAAYKYMNLSKWHTNDYICADCSLAYVSYFWTLSFLNCAFYRQTVFLAVIPDMMDISANQLFYSSKNFVNFIALHEKKSLLSPLLISNGDCSHWGSHGSGHHACQTPAVNRRHTKKCFLDIFTCY